MLQAGNAFAAAAIASFVSASPISGTVPSSELSKGSGERQLVQVAADLVDVKRTRHRDSLTTLRIHPFAIDIRLELDESSVFQTELQHL